MDEICVLLLASEGLMVMVGICCCLGLLSLSADDDVDDFASLSGSVELKVNWTN